MIGKAKQLQPTSRGLVSSAPCRSMLMSVKHTSAHPNEPIDTFPTSNLPKTSPKALPLIFHSVRAAIVLSNRCYANTGGR